MKTLISAALFILSLNTFADEIFVIKKSYHEKNELHFSATVKECALVSKSISPLWMMGEKGEGVTELLSSSEKPDFTPIYITDQEQEVEFTLGALNRVEDKVDHKSIVVRLVNCKAKAFFLINGKESELKEIYLQVKTRMGIPRGVESVLLKGLAKGTAVEQKVSVD